VQMHVTVDLSPAMPMNSINPLCHPQSSQLFHTSCPLCPHKAKTQKTGAPLTILIRASRLLLYLSLPSDKHGHGRDVRQHVRVEIRPWGDKVASWLRQARWPRLAVSGVSTSARNYRCAPTIQVGGSDLFLARTVPRFLTRKLYLSRPLRSIAKPLVSNPSMAIHIPDSIFSHVRRFYGYPPNGSAQW
jgi:hypothetical protein